MILSSYLYLLKQDLRFPIYACILIIIKIWRNNDSTLNSGTCSFDDWCLAAPSTCHFVHIYERLTIKARASRFSTNLTLCLAMLTSEVLCSWVHCLVIL